MEELIAFIATKLVDHPEAVAVTVRTENETAILELRVAQEDLGKVIGKQGRTIRAMRAVLNAAAEEDQRVRLEIIEE